VQVELAEKVEAIVGGKGGVLRWFVIADHDIGFSRTVEENCALRSPLVDSKYPWKSTRWIPTTYRVIMEAISWSNSGAPGYK
jgi:hypothetical protein